jgi:hypothetical protein
MVATLKNADGTPLNPLDVGLGKKKLKVRASFSDELRSYLDGREDWITHIRGFRDSLAHCIPLYIPPFVVHPDQLDKDERLGAAGLGAVRRPVMMTEA